jgi:hypothetical protein
MRPRAVEVIVQGIGIWRTSPPFSLPAAVPSSACVITRTGFYAGVALYIVSLAVQVVSEI